MLSIRKHVVRSLKTLLCECFFLKEFFMGFTKFEKGLWAGSILLIASSFLIFDRSNYFNLIASLVGATSLIFCAKGNPFGYTYRYYGELITYVFMTGPMAVLSLISWLKHPFMGKKSQVEVSNLTKKDAILAIAYSIIVTVIFYFILQYFNTENLFFSTVSITTSFVAVYLTYKRSPYYALAYMMNDIVLIILWTFATLKDPSYVSVIICFIVFLINDTYGFISWKRMLKKQKALQ